MIYYSGEDQFAGVVRRGLAGDNVDLPWHRQRIVIVGHGPYAVEQVRTGLDYEAEHVQLLVRRHGLICPQMLDYLNIVRPIDGDLTRPSGGAG